MQHNTLFSEKELQTPMEITIDSSLRKRLGILTFINIRFTEIISRVNQHKKNVTLNFDRVEGKSEKKKWMSKEISEVIDAVRDICFSNKDKVDCNQTDVLEYFLDMPLAFYSYLGNMLLCNDERCNVENALKEISLLMHNLESLTISVKRKVNMVEGQDLDEIKIMNQRKFW